MTVLLSLARPLAGQERQPWFGTWSLDLSQPAQNSQPPRYKRVTSRIEPWADGLKVTYDMVGIRGGVTHWEWIGKFDGKDYLIQGVDTVLTNAYTRIDGNNYEIVVKLDGAVVATSRVGVSPDGNTLRVATNERIAGGQTVKTSAVYKRLE